MIKALLTLWSVPVLRASTGPSFQNSLRRSMSCMIITSLTWMGLVTPFLDFSVCAFLNSTRYYILHLIQKWCNTLFNSISHLKCSKKSFSTHHGKVLQEGSSVGDNRSDERVWQILLNPQLKSGRGASECWEQSEKFNGFYSPHIRPNWFVLMTLTLHSNNNPTSFQIPKVPNSEDVCEAMCEAQICLNFFFQWSSWDIPSLTLPFAQLFSHTRGLLEIDGPLYLCLLSTFWRLDVQGWMILSSLQPWR